MVRYESDILWIFQCRRMCFFRSADIIEGLHLVWNPSIIPLCQILWIGIFLYMGRSQVTGSRITFHVRKDRI